MEQWLLNNLLAFGLAFLLTGILIPQILVIAFRKNLFDGHDTRKLHSGKVPRLGGVAFVPAIIFSVLATLGWSMHVDGIQMMDVLSDTIVPLLFLICTLMLLFLVGIADDLIGVRYGAKFLFQMLAALLMVVSGVWLQN
ncbi:MAG: undecaprenyl/decaprenyl-phosphate alpha-N-acetylglucosaminyl 1-phosphate transferase, partial [Muribaculaceae bacterium]|nr:undecaprenyl/decaprenyl-phosphate alpha-N-acetylglucosaminyl 1-phosphate transferase [Muribaculaceae bacterium]